MGVERRKDEGGGVTSSHAEPALMWQAKKVEFAFELDNDRKAAIARCLEAGDLRIVLNDVRVDVAGGLGLRAGALYEWD
jgi:hypothetical protein